MPSVTSTPFVRRIVAPDAIRVRSIAFFETFIEEMTIKNRNGQNYCQSYKTNDGPEMSGE